MSQPVKTQTILGPEGFNPFLPPPKGPTAPGTARIVATAISNHPILFASAVGGLAASFYTGSYYLGAAAAGAIGLIGNKFFAAMNKPQIALQQVMGYIPPQNQQDASGQSPVFTQPKASTLEKRFTYFAKRYGFIWFYKSPENKETEVFGNFYEQPFTYKGAGYRCSEAAFQAQKFIHHPTLMAEFRNFDGATAASTAKKWKAHQRKDWMSVSLKVMHDVLQVKFQDPTLRSLLLATGPAYLVEHIPVKGRDAFYGDDNDGTGQNHLGKLLMDVRHSLGGTGRVTPPQAYLANPTGIK